MCQCVCCNCWWYNCLGSMMSGCAVGYICCGCWVCKKQDMATRDVTRCYCGDLIGCGGNICCVGSLMCAPDWLKHWSTEKRNYYK